MGMCSEENSPWRNLSCYVVIVFVYENLLQIIISHIYHKNSIAKAHWWHVNFFFLLGFFFFFFQKKKSSGGEVAEYNY